MRRWTTALAWGTVAFDVGVLVTVVWLSHLAGGVLGTSVVASGMLAFSILGALVARRHPGNLLGWTYLAIGTVWELIFLADLIIEVGLDRGITPTRIWPVVWYAEWAWVPGLFLLFVFSMLLFPDGRLPSPRWRPAAVLALLIMLVATFMEAFAQRLDTFYVVVDNPLALLPVDDVEEGVQGALLAVGMVASSLAAVSSLMVRYRRGREVERQQLKWFVLSGAALLSGFVGLGVLDAITGYRPVVLDVLLITGYSAGVGIAILRYRLYDIDLVINRTLVYLSLTVLLAGVYVGGVLLLSRLLPVEGNDLAVAASTLAVAALFSPARKGIQAFVDRRFYRSRYDARRTLEAFGSRSRDQVDLRGLLDELQEAARLTLHPVHVSIWIRPEALRKR